MNKLFVVAGLSVLLASCKQNKPADEDTDIQYQDNTVYVPENSTVNSKIKLVAVAAKDYSAEFNATGIVRAIAGQMVGIAPPFEGRISRSFVKLGQKVNAGTPVFELHSAGFFEATKDYFQTLQTKKTKELNLQRQRDLVAHGVGVAKELEAAETDYEIALKDYETAAATLKMFNIHREDIKMGQALQVVSPIAGEVVMADIVIGQYVKSDAAPLVIVAELDKVWVVAQVKERYIGAIRPDDRVEIRTDADFEQVVTGHVSHISELLDEETRSVQVLITCDNKDRKLKPGMFTSVHFINMPKKSILIPATALLQKEDGSYVFVQESKETYAKRNVKAVTANGHEMLVTDGLKAGDVIVSEGGIYLMAE